MGYVHKLSRKLQWGHGNNLWACLDSFLDCLGWSTHFLLCKSHTTPSLAPKQAQISSTKNFSCISCNSVFLAHSTYKGENVKTDICSNCNPFFIGTSSSKVRVGKVEAFYKREEKSKK